MFSSIIILLILPKLTFSLLWSSLFRPIYRYYIFKFFNNFILLVFVGAQSTDYPFITLGIISTLYYFLFILLIIPIISLIEALIWAPTN
jgi:ubiquinol-cytochrome c reductase cytochrome b subunit